MQLGRAVCLRGLMALSIFMGCSEKSSPTKIIDPLNKVPFDTSVTSLPMALVSEVLELKDGDTLKMTVSWVAKEIAGRKIRMLAYNQTIPGPILKVAQGSRLIILLQNQTKLPASLHSHGVRLDYRYDGVPGINPAIDSGKTATYVINFPDPGMFWYHPHYREDYQMELGLYGTYLVVPKDSTYWPPVNREVVLMLDDILLDEKGVHPFYQNATDYAMMGRFGNVLLINGNAQHTLHVKRNETIRFYTLNAASARVFNLQYSRDMDMHIIGSDNGRYEFPSARENYLIAPSERVIFQLGFNDGLDDYDTLALLNVTPTGTTVLSKIVYDADTIETDLRTSLALKQSSTVTKSIDPFRAAFNKLPDEEILLTGYMDMDAKLKKNSAVQHDPDPSNTLGIEWNDSVHGPAMVRMNQMSDTRNMHWTIQDIRTGRENHEIHWKFNRGSQVMIRIHNDTAMGQQGIGSVPEDRSLMFHPMPHPIHFHGQRFLVIRENGKRPLEGLVWRDSYLVGRGYTLDLLLDASNPGEWMFHCHIAEHFESDMMGHFSVQENWANGKIPFPWSLSIKFETALDSIIRDTSLALPAEGEITGRINAFNPVILNNWVQIINSQDPLFNLNLPLTAEGAFHFSAESLLGKTKNLVNLKIFVTPKDTGYRPSPDTLRIVLDRREKLSWSLDLDLAGEAVFQSLSRDTLAMSKMQGEVQGNVNGFQTETMLDTLYFRNMIYPEFFANVPISPTGDFQMNASEMVGSLDGLHIFKIFLKSKTKDYRLSPDTLKIDLSIP